MKKPRSVTHPLNKKVPHLFAAWPRIAARLRRAKHVAVFLDFDGTLVGFKPRPEQVTLHEPARTLISRLAQQPKLSVFLISGRRRADLRSRGRVPGVGYMGLHGWERDRRQSLSVESQKSLRAARKVLAAALDGLPGVWIEDKKPAFVVHYRKASAADGRRAVTITRREVTSRERELHLMEGNKVVDVLPLEIKGKGQAVLDELSNQPYGTLALYAGDDTTDETAFAALAGRGITILVGSRRQSQARYKVRNPEELICFLQRLQEGLR